MEEPKLSPLELWYLRQSARPDMTRRRRTMIVVTGVLFAAALCGMAVLTESWRTVLGVALLYIAMTVWGQVGQMNAVLVYKSLVRKLAAAAGIEPGNGESK